MGTPLLRREVIWRWRGRDSEIAPTGVGFRVAQPNLRAVKGEVAPPTLSGFKC